MGSILCWDHWDAVSAIATVAGSVGVLFTLRIYHKLFAQAELARMDDKRPILCLRFREISVEEVPKISNRIVNVGFGPAFIQSFTKDKNSLAFDTVIGPASGDPELEVAFSVHDKFMVPQGTSDIVSQLPEIRVSGAVYVAEYNDVFGRRFRMRFESGDPGKHFYEGPL